MTGESVVWEPRAVDAAMGMVARAEEEIAAGIAFLQRAQEVEWYSVAGDVMREELYAAIQVLRSIDGELAESRRELAVLRCILDELGPVAA